MASLNALKLGRQRYGQAFKQSLKEITARNEWSAEQFIEYQRQRLRLLLEHAAAKSPYYRRVFAENRIAPDDIKTIDDLHRLRILEKSIVRSDPRSLLDETLDTKKLVRLHTSGTTGTPIELYRDVLLSSAVFAYAEARWHAMAGMRRRINRSISVGGHLVVSPEQTEPPFWVYNRRWKQLYMSSYHLSPKYLAAYVEQMRCFKADYIEGYPSSVYAIAQHIVDNKLEPVPLKACFTTAETLFDYQREAVEKAFCCRTYNQYGCGEQVVFAAECEQGSMHLSPEVGIVEVLDDDDKPVPWGTTGQLICTSLINLVQPFIRYRLGDVGSLSDKQCACGSLLPVLGGIEGRTDAILITRDGRRIGRLDPVFKGAKGIAEAQIVQDDYDRFRVRIVPGREYTNQDGSAIAESLAHRVGRADIHVEIVDSIERTTAGKFRAVVCNLPQRRQAVDS